MLPSFELGKSFPSWVDSVDSGTWGWLGIVALIGKGLAYVQIMFKTCLLKSDISACKMEKNGSPLHVVCLWTKGASLMFLGESHWGYHRKWLHMVLVDGWESTFLLDLSIASVDTLAMKSLEGVTWHHPNIFRVPNRQPWYTQLGTGYPKLVTLYRELS